ncbi:hypothetical protein QTJ16_002284 [Diplocarpon rosae]|uniref:Uncharacterized protein n=1 Tax=Diplocarpon rosae TaxID=946125 RepID=A0AAD9T017_9HELO|nr:hypothetical protein QTJ16_002284 [Diplocarpon rosae]
MATCIHPPEGAPEGTTAGDLYMRGYELGRAYGLTNETPGPPPRNEYLTTGSWDLFDLGWNHGGAHGRLDAPPRAPATSMGGGGGGRCSVSRFGGGMGGPSRHMGPRDPGVWQIYTAADYEGSGEDEDEPEEPPRLSVRRGTYHEHEKRGQRSDADESLAFDQGLQQGRASVRGLGSQATIPDPPTGFSTQLRREWTDGYRSGRESMQTLIEEEKRGTIESHEKSERTAAREREIARVLSEQDIPMEDYDAVESDNDSDDIAEDNDSQETEYKEIIPSRSQAQVVQHSAPGLEVTTTPQATLDNTMSSVLSEAPTPTPIPVLDQGLIDPVLRIVAPLLAPPNTVNNNTDRAPPPTASQVSNAPITSPILLPVPPHSHMAPGFFATQAWIRGWHQGELAGRRNLSNRRPELQSASMGMSAEDQIAYIQGFGVGLADGARRL